MGLCTCSQTLISVGTSFLFFFVILAIKYDIALAVPRLLFELVSNS